MVDIEGVEKERGEEREEKGREKGRRKTWVGEGMGVWKGERRGEVAEGREERAGKRE